MQRKIIIVSQADMNKSVLFSDMQAVSDRRLKTALSAIASICDERSNYEATRERMFQGVLQVAQSPDIKFVDALKGNEAFARMVLALKIDPRSYIFPQSQADGKSSSETSNLKSYNKVRQIAECIWSGASDLENVAKVFSVCAFHFASNGREVLTRDDVACFLSSREFRDLDSGTADLWSAVDDVRAKYMSGGAETQSGQMVRSLVALKSAHDVRDGRNKNVRIDANAPVMQALMIRFGQLSD